MRGFEINDLAVVVDEGAAARNRVCSDEWDELPLRFLPVIFLFPARAERRGALRSAREKKLTISPMTSWLLRMSHSRPDRRCVRSGLVRIRSSAPMKK